VDVEVGVEYLIFSDAMLEGIVLLRVVWRLISHSNSCSELYHSAITAVTCRRIGEFIIKRK